MDERTRLLSDQVFFSPPRPGVARLGSGFGSYRADHTETEFLDEGDITSSFGGLNALDIAAVAEAKNFLSQRNVQKVVNGIWSGEIVFWETLSVHTKKKAQLYNARYVW